MQTTSPRTRLSAFALAVTLAAAALAGCSGAPRDKSASSPGSSAAASSSVDPASPAVVAAAAVGTRSRTQVVSLHAMGVSTTRDDGLPRTELPRQGAVIQSALRGQVQDATRLPPPAGSPAGRLVVALQAYAGLAGRLAAWDPNGAALPQRWFATLTSTDASWKAAMRDLSELSDTDLLADLPVLILPSS